MTTLNEVELGLSKFNNINGVTCYMNSILAILQQIPILSDYIINGMFKEDLLKNKSANEIKDSIIYNIYRVLKTSLENDNKNITPTSFRKVISKKDCIWGENQHQDSQEFLNFVLTNIEDEIKRDIVFLPGRNFNIKNKDLSSNIEELLALSAWQKSLEKEYSPIKMLFSGQFQNIKECSLCKNNSTTFENFESLSLPIPIKNKGEDLVKEYSLDQCLEYYFKKEKLDKNNKADCGFCYLKNQTNIYNKIWRTPKVLVIQIKRFLINDYGIPTQKLINKINFPINNLNISKYINTNSPDKDKCIYNLIGVNYHYSIAGRFSCTFGHYVSVVKNRYDNEWYCFDDNKLIKCKKEKDILDRDSYLLFYYRTN